MRSAYATGKDAALSGDALKVEKRSCVGYDVTCASAFQSATSSSPLKSAAGGLAACPAGTDSAAEKDPTGGMPLADYRLRGPSPPAVVWSVATVTMRNSRRDGPIQRLNRDR